MTNIFSFQLLNCENLLLVFISCEYKLNIFGFRLFVGQNKLFEGVTLGNYNREKVIFFPYFLTFSRKKHTQILHLDGCYELLFSTER